MREKPWAAVPLLEPDKHETIWYPTDMDAHLDNNGSDRKGEREIRKAKKEAYDIQYRPGNKRKPR